MRIAKYGIVSTLAGLLIAFAVGCQGRSSIPADAQLENSGTGKVSFTAAGAGDVYVLDATSNTKVFQGHVNNGDQSVVEPDQDRIVVGGNNADHNPALNPNHRYEIFFKGS